MKRFEDLTELEIKDLTELDFIKLVMLEVAYAGIAVVDEPVYPQLAKMPEKDDVTYKIDGWFIIITMGEEDEAKRLAELLNSFESIKEDTDMFSVKPQRSYSKEKERLAKIIDAENQKLIAKYKECKAVYDDYVEKKEVIESPMRDKLNSIIEKYGRLDSIREKYLNTYLPLADNNVEIAQRFIKDAYVISKDDEDYIFKTKGDA